MFIRIKNIKGNKYAYRVRNKWTRSGTRQKTIGYLGKVYTIKPEKCLENTDFYEYVRQVSDVYYKKASVKQMVLDVIRYELYKHGFKMVQGRMKKEENSACLEVDFGALAVTAGKKPAVLNINNDFLCDYTLRRLVKFRSNSDQGECGKEFAQAFISAGIAITPGLFVQVFTKVYSRYGVSIVA